MFCSKCSTFFELTPIDLGKNRFCKNCGNLLYKNVNNDLILINGNLQQENYEDAERLKQEAALRQQLAALEKQKEDAKRLQEQQLALQKQQEIEAERNRQDELLKQRQLEIEAENKRRAEEAERKRQEELLIQRQIEIEAENKKLAEEKERKRQEELLKQKQIEIEAENKRLAEEAEAKKREELAKIKQKEIDDENEKNRLALLKQQQEEELSINHEPELNIEDNKDLSKSITSENETKNTESGGIKWIIGLVLAALIGALAYFLIDKFVISKEKDKVAATAETQTTVADSLFSPDKLKSDILNKEILGWGKINDNQIQSIVYKISSVADTNFIMANLNLRDQQTTAKATLSLKYIGSNFISLATENISFMNMAPTGKWFTFAPLANCAVTVNTNNEPMKFKNCENCEVKIITSNSSNVETLTALGDKLFIQSGTNKDLQVEFNYTPNK